jgi:hypothetical protein
MAVGSSRPGPLPVDTERRVGAFTELVATAIANTMARTELEQVASVQRTGQPLRIDDYTQIRSAIAEPARELDIGMAAGVPVLVGGRVGVRWW